MSTVFSDIPASDSRVGVVDVGSNSVRLVIFDGASRSPAYFFNEKVLCGLGRGLQETGRLNPDGRVRALAALDRFQTIAEGLGITPLMAVATAAMRVAEDGEEFRREILDKVGMDLRVIDGTEEAEFSAKGVLLGWPDASGLVCDIGGSSMELAQLSGGSIGWCQTSPLGPLELDRLNADPEGLRAFIDQHLKKMRKEMPEVPKVMYLVGGSWRAIAKFDMVRRDYPLHVLHEYRMDPDGLSQTLDILTGKSAGELRKAAGVSSDRFALLPRAAEVLRGILRVLGPEEINVSAYGLREGLLYEQMPESLRSSDPLLTACRMAEASSARVPGFGQQLFDFLRPLYPDADQARLRLIEAACLLHDVSWRSHPDYRAEVCFDFATRANLGGLTHADRIFLGLALLNRYKSGLGTVQFDRMRGMIPTERAKEAETLGKAMRFGAMFTLGTVPAAGTLSWDPKGPRLGLTLTHDTAPLFGEVAEGRFLSLARALGAETRIDRPD